MFSLFDGTSSEEKAGSTRKDFEQFRKSETWKKICMIHEVEGFFDIVIREEKDPACRALCGVCWNRSHLTPAQLQLIREKQQELEQRKEESLPDQGRKPRPRSYQYGIIGSWSCLDGIVAADSPEEAERQLRHTNGCDGTITVFY